MIVLKVLLWAFYSSSTAFLKFRDHKCMQYSRCGGKIYSDILVSHPLLVNLKFGLLFGHYWAYNGCSHQCIALPRPCSLLVIVSSESIILPEARPAALLCVHLFRSFKIISSTFDIKPLSLIRSCCNFSESSINLTTLCKTLGHQQVLSTHSSSWFPGHLWTWWKAQSQQRSLESYWLPPTIVRVNHVIFPFTFNFLFSI